MPLTRIDGGADLLEPTISPIEIVTEFPDFEAFGTPFTLGAGPAPLSGRLVICTAWRQNLCRFLGRRVASVEMRAALPASEKRQGTKSRAG